MSELEKARIEYKRAGEELDSYSVLNTNKNDMEKAKERYKKAVKNLLLIDENFRKIHG